MFPFHHAIRRGAALLTALMMAAGILLSLSGCADEKEDNLITTTSPLPSCKLLYSTSDGVFRYDIYEQYAEVTGYTGTGGVIVIPDTMDGYPVLSIGDGALRNNKIVEDVTLSYNVVNIGKEAFYQCTKLENITLRSVRAIGVEAFRGSGLTGVELPSVLENLGRYAFGDTPLTEITLPGSIVRSGTYVFAGCTKLKSITFGKGFSEISDRMFSYCTSLTEVTVSEDVGRIGAYAFASCASLTSVTIPVSVTVIDEGCFSSCPASMTLHTTPDSTAAAYAKKNLLSYVTDLSA